MVGGLNYGERGCRWVAATVVPDGARNDERVTAVWALGGP